MILVDIFSDLLFLERTRAEMKTKIDELYPNISFIRLGDVGLGRYNESK